MIIGFSHICMSADAGVQAIKPFIEQGWTVSEQFLAVPSPAEKWPLLSRQARSHDLTLLDGPIAVEIISHDTGAHGADSRIGIADDGTSIVVKVRDEAGERRFMEALGFSQQADGSLRLARHFPQWSVTLEHLASADAPLDPALDVDGYSCLAFYSSNPAENIEQLKAVGARDITAPFAMELGNRSMSIAMLRSPEGTIIELIKVNRAS